MTKFCGSIAGLWTLAWWWCCGSGMVCMHSDPVPSWKAMSAHWSQFVWFRRLFVVFSVYTFVNHLVVHDAQLEQTEGGKGEGSDARDNSSLKQTRPRASSRAKQN